MAMACIVALLHDYGMVILSQHFMKSLRRFSARPYVSQRYVAKICIRNDAHDSVL